MTDIGEAADPTPPGSLRRAWAQPRGLAALTEVNNTFIGALYVGTGILFLLLGGVLALMIRYQLAWPGNGFLTAEQYNQVFTLHGTTMMFLFAVPVMEAVSVWLMPLQLGARDLPFPRISAYGFWCYFFGGLMSYSSIFWWLAPDSGWFLYPPLATEWSPGVNNDFWLLGIGFIEISAIALVVETVVGIMKTRAVGMSIDRLPIYGWYMLVTALMIAFAFPPLILGDILMEVERALDWPFFDADRGGDPLLWQHLFWFFGHPEVYIIFLPAAGLVSTMLPTFVGRPLAGHSWVVLAAVSTGFLSFGLWVHHMFATGLPRLSLSFFSGASMAVAIPAGIQVFCWIATIWSGRPIYRVPFLFILGFLFIFVAGGMTGVMVASVPFDWQAHDSYFVVAHLHYVLIGGMVFPLFAAIYYWAPLYSGRMMSETLGRWAFGLMFVGFNVAFFPQHVLGLMGMPRRIYTYPAEFGWQTLNLVSSLGAATIALGIAVVVVDFLRHLRHGPPAGRNPWGAGTLEWSTRLPSPNAGFASVPTVSGRYPLWDDPRLPERMERGEFLLADSPHGWRETIRTGTVDARPEQIMVLPGPSWLPFLAAVLTTVAFGVSIFKFYVAAAGAAFLGFLVILAWAWELERRPQEQGRDVGGGLVLPYYATGPRSHAFWAMAVLIVCDSAAWGGLVFAWFFIWTVSGGWPPPDWAPAIVPPGLDFGTALAGGAVLALSGLLMAGAKRAEAQGRRGLLVAFLIAASLLGLGAGWLLVVMLNDSGFDPTSHVYPALVWMMVCFPLAHLALGLVLALFAAAKAAVRPRNRGWSHAVGSAVLWWQWTLVQTLLSLALLLLFPLLT